MFSGRFGRTALLAGSSMMSELADTRVIVFGVGGVGSWCVEALARTGTGHITVVDDDCVAESNINRQMPALTSTLGRPKVDVVADRIADINPGCDVTALSCRYTAVTADRFDLRTYDYVLDCIDSLSDKADLILRCTSPSEAPRRAFFSSMGAARRIDASAVAAGEFWKVTGCPLARALRTRFRRGGVFPQRKFMCVYSPEAALPQPSDAAANGTFAHVTAVFGLRMASLVVEHIFRRTREQF